MDIVKLVGNAGHSELARKMLRKQGLTASNMGMKYNTAHKILTNHMASGDMVAAREYAKSQRKKANDQGYINTSDGKMKR